MSTVRKQEHTGLGLKRIACAQVESAIRCLTRETGQSKAAKEAIDQARAILTLIEPDLPRTAARRDRTIINRLSQGLLPLHQPAMLAAQLDAQLRKNPSDPALASAAKTLRKRWAGTGKAGSAMNNKAGTFNPTIYRLVADMAELRGHLDAWPVENMPNDTPPRGLRRSYTRARKLIAEPIDVNTLPSVANAITELAIQLGLISKACPVMVKAQRKLVSRAANALQDLQESNQLNDALRAELSKANAKALPSSDAISKQIKDRIGSDLQDALAETPAAFMRRMQAYWSSWRASAA